MPLCAHCGSPVAVPATAGPEPAVASPPGPQFCCGGCEAAYGLIQGLGLDRYYERRCIDPAVRPLRPDDEAAPIDYALHAKTDETGIATLHLMVEGIHCAACVWLIESVLSRQPGVVSVRLNMTTRRLVVRWEAAENDAAALVATVAGLGYRLIPFDPAKLGSETEKHDRALLRAMAVAGFAAGNVMLLSVSVWAGHFQGMGPATRDLMHWLSALIVVPAVAYAGQPFFRSALAALKAGRTNMDVPISLGVLIATLMSLAETMSGGPHVYFDSAITLLFFLLVGRYLDSRARGKARSAAEHMLGLTASAVTVLRPDGETVRLPSSEVLLGATVLAAVGERIAVDGIVRSGASDVDTSLITGESVPSPIRPNDRVHAGTLNLSGPVAVEVTAVGEATLLAEIVRLMEAAEQGRAKYVALADRVARLYAPVVHALGLATFLGWWLFGGVAWQPALMTAVSVLIITCPCALALAVPVVQVVATGRLLRRGVLVKSATALERLATADTVVFDKTGTLTAGRPELLPSAAADAETLRLAAGMAAVSRHPLARALVRAVPDAPALVAAAETPGQGLALVTPEGEVRLGSRRWCGVGESGDDAPGPELWLARPGRAPIRFAFADALRPDAAAVLAALMADGYAVELLSGDRATTVAAIAAQAGIDVWRAGCAPADKCARLEELAAAGRRVLMVGDGLNDAPALAAAHVSLSPSTAVDVSQTAADAVFQGGRLTPVLEALGVARLSDLLVRQNILLALLYNAVTVPLAVAGFVTPLAAAIAMSSSSLVVIGNSLRLNRARLLRGAEG